MYIYMYIYIYTYTVIYLHVFQPYVYTYILHNKSDSVSYSITYRSHTEFIPTRKIASFASYLFLLHDHFAGWGEGELMGWGGTDGAQRPMIDERSDAARVEYQTPSRWDKQRDTVAADWLETFPCNVDSMGSVTDACMVCYTRRPWYGPTYLRQGRPYPLRPWCIFPLFQISPLFSTNFQALRKILTI